MVEAASDPQLVEDSKRRAAYYAVETHIKSGDLVGVGTGSTAKYLVDCLAERYKAGLLRDIICVPTSFQARHLIIDNGLPLSDLEQTPTLDICIDGADEVDRLLNCIKGGGGCLTQEKVVMSCARRFMVVCDFRKRSQRLGDRFKRLPLEVVPAAYVPVKRTIETREKGTCYLRMATKKAGPVITDNGNYVLDWEFPKDVDYDWTKLNRRLKMVAGMVETGLFIDVAERAYFGMADGSVCELVRKSLNNGPSSPKSGDEITEMCTLWGGNTVVASDGLNCR